MAPRKKLRLKTKKGQRGDDGRLRSVMDEEVDDASVAVCGASNEDICIEIAQISLHSCTSPQPSTTMVVCTAAEISDNPVVKCNKRKHKSNLSAKKKSKKTRSIVPDTAVIEPSVNVTIVEAAKPRQSRRTTVTVAVPAVPTMQVLRGTRHQADKRYQQMSNGKQCTAMAAIAAALSTTEPTWTAEYIDTLLDYGDSLYMLSVNERALPVPQISTAYRENIAYLRTNEVYRYFTIGNRRYKLEFDEPRSVDGVLIDSPVPDAFPVLRRGLDWFFETASAGIFTCNSMSIALFRNSGHYCVFDSHSRNKEGLPCPRGAACLIQTASLSALHDKMLSVFHMTPRRDTTDNHYCIVPLTITSTDDGGEDVVYRRLDAVPSAAEPTPAFTTYSDRDRVITNRNVASYVPPARAQRKTRVAEIGIVPEQPAYTLGEMTETCRYCGAKFFAHEAMSCCRKGRIVLDPVVCHPDMKDILSDCHPKSGQFMKNIKKYNSLLAFASINSTLRSDLGPGAPVYVICGMIYRNVADIHPNYNRKFGTLYFLEAEEATRARAALPIAEECDVRLLRSLDKLLRDHNPFARLYRCLGDVLKEEKTLCEARGERIPEIGLYFTKDPNLNSRTRNAPTAMNEVGVVYTSRDGHIPPPGLLTVYVREDDNAPFRTREISAIAPTADPLCYPIIFLFGEMGWSHDIQLQSIDVGEERPEGEEDVGRRRRKRFTMREFYQFRLMIRNEFNAILRCGKLTQQYIVDAYSKIEGDRLEFIRWNQTKLRAESYVGLLDYVQMRAEREGSGRTGNAIILPSTFQNGPRYMQQHYQDSMAIVSKFGKPTYFITMTCNPKAPEIVGALSRHLHTQDRPDMVVRVFEQMRKELMTDIKDRHCFGAVVAWVYVIEFQKRGLPHMHLLVTVDEANKLREPEDIDKFVCAELPDPETDTRLFEIVSTVMIHGPCGSAHPDASCMKDGKCTKNYPKRFCESTAIRSGRAVEYRRREGSRAYIERRNKQLTVDNRDVVPYNPFLTLKYVSHINVDVCESCNSPKYLFKYINKGADAAILEVGDELVYDEPTAYQESRYLSSCEAMWRIMGYPLQGKSHTVVRLPVHLPGEKTVYFIEGEEEQAVQRASDKCSMLEAFFNLNKIDRDAHKYVYTDIPLHYRFENSRWMKRKNKRHVVSRMYTISPRYAHKFHLRILLLYVRGPTSFEDLRTVDGVLCDSFQEACVRRQLTTTDDEWERALREASADKMPKQMRKMFAYMLAFCRVLNPFALWNAYKKFMSEDYTRRGASESDAENRALFGIQALLRNNGCAMADFGLPTPLDIRTTEAAPDEEMLDQIVADTEESDRSLRSLNDQQRAIYNSVMEAIDADRLPRRYFCLQGSGGTGKTFLYNTILTSLAARGIPATAVAFTGIAALLLRGGRTAHSAFKLPLNLDADSTSRIKAQSNEAAFLRRVKLIVWDEITMTSYHALNVVDNLLQDLRRDTRPFGGVCFVVGGDAKQLLPVAPDRVTQVELCFTNCRAWEHFQVIVLTTNMRLDSGQEEFADWLDKLGRGRLQPQPPNPFLTAESIVLPEQCLTKDVVTAIYGNLKQLRSETFRDTPNRIVLCPRNDYCDGINQLMLGHFPGDTICCLSADSVDAEDADSAGLYPIEYLNSLTPTGMPPHNLLLKKGCPVMLLKNVDLDGGLINGTRLIVMDVTERRLIVEIVTGRRKGDIRWLTRGDMCSSDEKFQFVLHRRQFPVRVCFALTINKAQGQTFDSVGVYLPTSVFSHGQLYVAFSRVRNWNSIKIQLQTTTHQGRLVKNSPTIYTRNVVYQSVLQRLGIN